MLGKDKTEAPEVHGKVNKTHCQVSHPRNFLGQRQEIWGSLLGPTPLLETSEKEHRGMKFHARSTDYLLI